MALGIATGTPVRHIKYGLAGGGYSSEYVRDETKKMLHFSSVAKLLRDDPNQLYRARINYNIASHLVNYAMAKKARKFAETAMSIYRSSLDPYDIRLGLGGLRLGQVHMDGEDYDEALTELNAAHVILRHNSHPLSPTARDLVRLTEDLKSPLDWEQYYRANEGSFISGDLDAYVEAVDMLERSLLVLQHTHGNRSEQVIEGKLVLVQFCLIAFMKDRAERVLDDLMLFRDYMASSSRPALVLALGQSGHHYQDLGRLDLAFSLLDQVLDRSIELRLPGAVNIAQYLIDLHVGMGRQDLADQVVVEVLSNPDSRMVANLAFSLGVSLSLNGQDEMADHAFELALKNRFKFPDSESLEEIGLSVVGKEDPTMEDLRAFVRSILEPETIKGVFRAEGLGEYPETVWAPLRLIEHQRNGELDEFVLVLESMVREMASGQQIAGNLDLMSKDLVLTYTSHRDPGLTIPVLEELHQALSMAKGRASPQSLLVLSEWARSLTRTGRSEDAFELMQVYLEDATEYLHTNLWGASETTRRALLAGENDFRDRFLALAVSDRRQKGPRAALHYSVARKGLILEVASQVAALTKLSRDPEIAAISEDLDRYKKQLAGIGSAGIDTIGSQLSATRMIEHLEAELGLRVAELGRAGPRVTPGQIIDRLRPGQALLDYLIFRSQGEHRLVAVWVDPLANDPVSIVDLGELSKVARATIELRSAIDGMNQVEATELSREVYDLVFAKVAALATRIDEIYLVPDGVLHLLPFAQLLDHDDRMLVQTYQLRTLSFAREIVDERTSTHAATNALFAAPLFDPDQKARYAKGDPGEQLPRTVQRDRGGLFFAPLPGTLLEGRQIARLFADRDQSVDQYFLDRATETQLQAIRSPRVLHLATHGYFLEPSDASDLTGEHPLLRAGLALTNANLALETSSSDGILTAIEALALHLEGTDLVTLSACETGVGEIATGDGVYGLQRAFIEAGAGAVLYSLWELDDLATIDFMTRFYTHYLTNRDPQGALHRTQLEMIADKDWSMPFYWAGFVVSGP